MNVVTVRDRCEPGVSPVELVALVCCDLGAIVRGRALPAAELDAHLTAGVGWTPANHSLTPLGPLAEPNPFGSIGDLRLVPDMSTRARVDPRTGAQAEHRTDAGSRTDTDSRTDAGSQGVGPLDPSQRFGRLDLVLCDIVETDGRPWECCPRRWLRDALDELEREHGLRAMASFEHEFQLLGGSVAGNDDRSRVSRKRDRRGDKRDRRGEHRPDGELNEQDLGGELPFSLTALRDAEPFARDVMGALIQAGAEPERIFAEYAPHQFEIPVHPADGLAAADRSVVFGSVVREVARRHGARATFTPLLDPAQAGNGVHIHLTLLDAQGQPALYDATRPGCLSELGERFAAGILLHAPALIALTAPSPVSAARLTPHHWSAGAVCLGQRNRETLLRLPPLVSIGGVEEARQLRLEYRGADATANPYLALGAILRAGMDGLRAGLPAPPILDRDPAELDPVESERYGVGALPASQEHALQALAEDVIARAWMTPLLYDAYAGVHRAEMEMTAGWDIERLAERYGAIY